jgi:hypothetical protein
VRIGAKEQQAVQLSQLRPAIGCKSINPSCP